MAADNAMTLNSGLKQSVADNATVVWRQSPRNLREYPHILYISRNWSHWSTFLSPIAFQNFQIFVAGSKRRILSALECVSVVMVIQGRWFWYQSKAHMRLSI